VQVFGVLYAFWVTYVAFWVGIGNGGIGVWGFVKWGLEVGFWGGIGLMVE
jgi:hypothetical protein